jgi:sugar phosphate isomerase/epimerase
MTGELEYRRKMPYQSRRDFAKRLVAGAGALGMSAGRVNAADKLSDIGVQLYTVRNIILNNPAQVLKTIEDIGYREVELVWASMDKIWADLKKTSLKPVSIHMDSQLFLPDKKAELDVALHKAKEHDFEYAVYPAVPRPDRERGADFFKAMAEKLSDAGTKCRKLGMQFCYHNHAFDFRQLGSMTPLEILMRGTSPDTLALEADVFWVSVAGHNPVEFLKSYAGRIPMVHLKNKAEGMGVQFNENVPPSAFREVGKGSLDIPAILSTAESIGAKHFFVEQDQTPGDPLESLRASYSYLSGLRF